jgi:hypothetical protein
MKDKIEIKIGKMPQKLEEDLGDSMETVQIHLEQVAELCYQRGFEEGYKKGLKNK